MKSTLIRAVQTMEAEQLNQLENALADLQRRTLELRRYL
jgi:hypothetical protein